MNKTYKTLLSSFAIAFFILLLPLSLKAQTMDDLKNQFTALGGSEDGFNKIIQVVQKSQDASSQLKTKIEQTYNKQMFDSMVAPTFDPNSYTQVYNNLEQEKSQLVKQNLQDMVNLLQSLSVKDRQAYAQLLYGVNNAVPNAQSGDEQSGGSNNGKANTSNNTTSNNNATNNQNAQGSNNNQQSGANNTNNNSGAISNQSGNSQGNDNSGLSNNESNQQ